MPCDLLSFRPNSVVSTNQNGEERHPGLPPTRQARSKAARGSQDHDVRRDFGIASCDPRRPRSSSSDCYRILSCLRLGSLRLSRAPGFRFNHAAEMSVARRSPVGCKSLAPGRAVSVDVCLTIWRLTIWRRAFDRHRPPAPDRGDSSVGRWLPGVRRHGGRNCTTTCRQFRHDRLDPYRSVEMRPTLDPPSAASDGRDGFQLGTRNSASAEVPVGEGGGKNKHDAVLSPPLFQQFGLPIREARRHSLVGECCR